MVMPTVDRDLRLKSVSRPDRNWLRKRTALPCLLRGQPAQGAVWTDLIEPVFEVVHPALDAPLCQARQDKAPPDAKGSECPLDLAVQIGRPDSSLHGDDAPVPHGRSELLAELRAMVGDDKSRLAELPGHGAYLGDHVLRSRRTKVDAQAQQAPGEAVLDCRHMDAEPEHLQGQQVDLPDAVDPLRPEKMTRLLAHRQSHRRPGRTTWPWGLGLSQHALHGAAADLDAGAEDLPRNPAGTELRLRKEPAEFVDGPANRIIDSVPDHSTTQQTRPSFAFRSPDPGTNRVAMHDEALGGLLDAPTPAVAEAARWPAVGLDDTAAAAVAGAVGAGSAGSPPPVGTGRLP